MKLFIIVLLSYTFVSAQTLSISEQQLLKTYNNRPSLKHTVDRRMNQLAKVNRIEAKTIADPLCETDKATFKLKHKDSYLFYEVIGDSCTLYINALDGSLLSREELYD